ncbi:MAG TPA: hypothetical protein VFS34_11680 [Thermoanaerobaculia bacterium]|nr:hypothetical protein [Thermoanaerobaculia bacterium]
MFRRVSTLLLAISLAASTRIAQACPLCADNLANDVYGKNPTQLGRGFFWSIIFMMALPFVTVGIVAARILIARRRRSAARDAAAGGASPERAGAMGLPEASS